ncbi:hypothetical protein [Amycolatopsis antarctica]|nr:hypothetical protein [Amycolatopsis antarctica]
MIDAYVETEDQRLDQPVHGGIVVLHRMPGSTGPAGGSVVE